MCPKMFQKGLAAFRVVTNKLNKLTSKKITSILTGLFAIPSFLGGASGGVLGVFGGVFSLVFGQFPGRNFEENSRF